VAAETVHQPHTVREQRQPRRPASLRIRSCFPLCGAQENQILLRCGCLLLSGNEIHRPRGTVADRPDEAVSGMQRSRNACHQRTDVKHGRLLRPDGLEEPPRPQAHSAETGLRPQQPHHQGRASERTADGSPARLHRSGSGNGKICCREFPGLQRQHFQDRCRRDEKGHREIPSGTDHFRQEHGAAQGACRRDPEVRG